MIFFIISIIFTLTIEPVFYEPVIITTFDGYIECIILDEEDCESRTEEFAKLIRIRENFSRKIGIVDEIALMRFSGYIPYYNTKVLDYIPKDIAERWATEQRAFFRKMKRFMGIEKEEILKFIREEKTQYKEIIEIFW